jgi:hypothetical protein
MMTHLKVGAFAKLDKSVKRERQKYFTMGSGGGVPLL